MLASVAEITHYLEKLAYWEGRKGEGRGKERRGEKAQWKNKKKERSHTNNLTAHPKALEQKEESLSKRSRRQEMTKLGTEINKIETKRTIQKNQ